MFPLLNELALQAFLATPEPLPHNDYDLSKKAFKHLIGTLKAGRVLSQKVRLTLVCLRVVMCYDPVLTRV